MESDNTMLVEMRVLYIFCAETVESRADRLHTPLPQERVAVILSLQMVEIRLF